MEQDTVSIYKSLNPKNKADRIKFVDSLLDLCNCPDFLHFIQKESDEYLKVMHLIRGRPHPKQNETAWDIELALWRIFGIVTDHRIAVLSNSFLKEFPKIPPEFISWCLCSDGVLKGELDNHIFHTSREIRREVYSKVCTTQNITRIYLITTNRSFLKFLSESTSAYHNLPKVLKEDTTVKKIIMEYDETQTLILHYDEFNDNDVYFSVQNLGYDVLNILKSKPIQDESILDVLLKKVHKISINIINSTTLKEHFPIIVKYTSEDELLRDLSGKKNISSFVRKCPSIIRISSVKFFAKESKDNEELYKFLTEEYLCPLSNDPLKVSLFEEMEKIREKMVKSDPTNW